MLAPLVLLLLGASPAPSAAPAPAARPAEDRTFRYQLGFLRRGPRPGEHTPEELERIQAGHLANIRAMWKQGVLTAAGPFGEDTPLRGVLLFTCDAETARRATAEDPAVKAGRLVLDLHVWVAQAGVGEAYRKLREAEPDGKDEMVTYPMAFLLAGGAPSSAEIAAGHRAHLERLRAQGKVLADGPIGGEAELQAVVVFRPGSLEEARALAEADPAVKAGHLKLEMHTWWAVKGVLPEPAQP
jgi:uncharacterized protein YciI